SRLGEAARETLRFAVALGGEVPHQAHLPALVGDTHADAAVGELLAAGLITVTGAHYRLAAGVTDELLADGYGRDSAELAHAAAQHYAWWTGHPSVTPERVALEADAILAAAAALASGTEEGHAETAVLLARTAAPAFAAALHWSAWERCLRHGQAAARRTGAVAEEAYFHHELGVMALCTGNLDRARAELEASIGMRGVLADKRGAIAGRRALALVTDRSGHAAQGPAAPRPEPAAAAGPPVPAIPPAAPSALVRGVRPTAGEEVPDARREESLAPPSVSASASSAFAGAPDQITTAALRRPQPSRPRQQWARKLMVSGTRRNLAAAGAGALLAAVLGTVVTLGATTGGHDGDAGDGATKPDRSASQQDGDNSLTADQRRPGEAGHAQVPGRPGKPGQSASPGASGHASPGASGSASPSGGPSDGGHSSGSPSSGGSPSHGGSSSPSSSSSAPSSKPPESPSKPPSKDPTGSSSSSSGGSTGGGGTAGSGSASHSAAASTGTGAGAGTGTGAGGTGNRPAGPAGSPSA
ncbi:ATP-binding protein, partial [Streptomyces sp. UNOC14_S4]|nr:ATP-binding protein [Streptomyces sp. UNOC14_S4]